MGAWKTMMVAAVVMVVAAMLMGIWMNMMTMIRKMKMLMIMTDDV